MALLGFEVGAGVITTLADLVGAEAVVADVGIEAASIFESTTGYSLTTGEAVVEEKIAEITSALIDPILETKLGSELAEGALATVTWLGKQAAVMGALFGMQSLFLHLTGGQGGNSQQMIINTDEDRKAAQRYSELNAQLQKIRSRVWEAHARELPGLRRVKVNVPDTSSRIPAVRQRNVFQAIQDATRMADGVLGSLPATEVAQTELGVVRRRVTRSNRSATKREGPKMSIVQEQEAQINQNWSVTPAENVPLAITPPTVTFQDPVAFDQLLANAISEVRSEDHAREQRLFTPPPRRGLSALADTPILNLPDERASSHAVNAVNPDVKQAEISNEGGVKLNDSVSSAQRSFVHDLSNIALTPIRAINNLLTRVKAAPRSRDHFIDELDESLDISMHEALANIGAAIANTPSPNSVLQAELLSQYPPSSAAGTLFTEAEKQGFRDDPEPQALEELSSPAKFAERTRLMNLREKLNFNSKSARKPNAVARGVAREPISLTQFARENLFGSGNAASQVFGSPQPLRRIGAGGDPNPHPDDDDPDTDDDDPKKMSDVPLDDDNKARDELKRLGAERSRRERLAIRMKNIESYATRIDQKTEILIQQIYNFAITNNFGGPVVIRSVMIGATFVGFIELFNLFWNTKNAYNADVTATYNAAAGISDEKEESGDAAAGGSGPGGRGISRPEEKRKILGKLNFAGLSEFQKVYLERLMGLGVSVDQIEIDRVRNMPYDMLSETAEKKGFSIPASAPAPFEGTDQLQFLRDTLSDLLVKNWRDRVELDTGVRPTNTPTNQELFVGEEGELATIGIVGLSIQDLRSKIWEAGGPDETSLSYNHNFWATPVGERQWSWETGFQFDDPDVTRVATPIDLTTDTGLDLSTAQSQNQQVTQFRKTHTAPRYFRPDLNATFKDQEGNLSAYRTPIHEDVEDLQLAEFQYVPDGSGAQTYEAERGQNAIHNENLIEDMLRYGGKLITLEDDYEPPGTFMTLPRRGINLRKRIRPTTNRYDMAFYPAIAGRAKMKQDLDISQSGTTPMQLTPVTLPIYNDRMRLIDEYQEDTTGIKQLPTQFRNKAQRLSYLNRTYRRRFTPSD